MCGDAAGAPPRAGHTAAAPPPHTAAPPPRLLSRPTALPARPRDRGAHTMSTVSGRRGCHLSCMTHGGGLSPPPPSPLTPASRCHPPRTKSTLAGLFFHYLDHENHFPALITRPAANKSHRKRDPGSPAP